MDSGVYNTLLRRRFEPSGSLLQHLSHLHLACHFALCGSQKKLKNEFSCVRRDFACIVMQIAQDTIDEHDGSNVHS